MQGHTLHRRHRFRAQKEGAEAGKRHPAGDGGVAPRLATALHDAGARMDRRWFSEPESQQTTWHQESAGRPRMRLLWRRTVAAFFPAFVKLDCMSQHHQTTPAGQDVKRRNDRACFVGTAVLYLPSWPPAIHENVIEQKQHAANARGNPKPSKTRSERPANCHRRQADQTW